MKPPQPLVGQLGDAHDEIKRLRALSQNNAHSWDAIVRERDRLRAENEQLRKGFDVMQETLIAIVANSRNGEWTLPCTFEVCANAALQKAVYGVIGERQEAWMEQSGSRVTKAPPPPITGQSSGPRQPSQQGASPLTYDASGQEVAK